MERKNVIVAAPISRILHERLTESLKIYNAQHIDIDPSTNVFRSTEVIKEAVKILEIILLFLCIKKNIEMLNYQNEVGQLWLYIQRNLGSEFEQSDMLRDAQKFLNAHAWDINTSDDIDAKIWTMNEFVCLVEGIQAFSTEAGVVVAIGNGFTLMKH